MQAIEVYGIEKLNRDTVLNAIGIRVGERLTLSRREIEERLESLPDVIQSHAEGHCCVQDAIVLYVGIVESGSKPFALHSPPSEDLDLPTKLDLVYQRLLRALEAAYERGATGETYDRGYPISEDDEARRAQETLALLVDPFVEDLGTILHRAADEPTRAAAAYILAYTKEKSQAEDHLQYALRDFDPDVRLNALRSLEFIRRALVTAPANEDGSHPTISPTWLIEMLHSVSLQDRIEASKMLVRLIAPENQSALEHLEDRSLPELVQMAQWTLPEHAEAPYFLLGRIAQIPEAEIRKSFQDRRLEVVLNPIRERAKKKKRLLLF